MRNDIYSVISVTYEGSGELYMVGFPISRDRSIIVTEIQKRVSSQGFSIYTVKSGDNIIAELEGVPVVVEYFIKDNQCAGK